MKKYAYISLLALTLSISGCNSIHHNDSIDDIWIQQQVEQGNKIPDALK